MHNESLNNDATSGDAVKTNEIMEKLGAYVDGELSRAERERVEILLQKDKSCRDAVQSFRFLDDAARRESVPPVSAREWARIWDTIQRTKDLPLTSESVSETVEGGKVISGSRLFFRLAAVAAVIVLAFVGFRMMQPNDSETEKDIVRPEPTVTDPPEILDKNGPDDDGEESIAEFPEIIGGEAPDEIGEDHVIYRDF